MRDVVFKSPTTLEENLRLLDETGCKKVLSG